MNLGWTIRFKTEQEKDGVINIYGNDVDVETVLEGSGVPFETEEDTDEDLMKPVRYQTGYIRVLDEDNLDGLMPKNLMDRYVEYLEDGELVWRGYMQPNTLSEPWDSKAIEVEFPVISPLGVLEGKYLDSGAYMGVTSFSAIIREMFELIQTTYREVYIPMEWKDVESGDSLIPMRLGVARFNFFTDSEKDKDDESWYMYESDPCLSILEELCKFFGWTVCERGDVLYFVSRKVRNYVKLSWNDFLTLSYGQTLGELEQVSSVSYGLEDLELAGSNHTKSVLPGYKKVTIKAGVNPVDDAVPNISEDQMEFVGSVRYEGKGVAEIGGSHYDPKLEQTRMYKSNSTNIEFKMYRYNLGNNVWEPLFYNAKESRNYAAADYVQYDAFTEKELEDKKNYNFRNALRVTSYDISMQLYPDLAVLRDKPVAIIRSKRAANYQNGAFVISANIGENSLENYDEFSMYVRLKVGNLYWNGDTWTVNSTAFEVPIDVQGKKIKNTKELDMPYNGADGYIIPIDRRLSGDTELTIYPLNRGNLAFFEDLKVSYYGNDDVTDNIKEGDTNRYYQKTDVPFIEEKELSIKLATSNKNKAGYGLICLNGDEIEELWSLVNGEMIRPERYLLETMSAIYGRTTDKLEVELMKGEIRPIDFILWHERQYMMIAEAVDWSSGTSVVIMEDIP